MAKRNQYNRGAFATPMGSTNWTCTDMRFAGSIDTATATVERTDHITNGSVITISQSAFTGSSAGTVIMTNVDLSPQQNFEVHVHNGDIPGTEGWMAFTQLSGPTGSYSNLVVLPFAGNVRMRVASQTDTIVSGDRVELSYFLVRSLDG